MRREKILCFQEVFVAEGGSVFDEVRMQLCHPSRNYFFAGPVARKDFTVP